MTENKTMSVMPIIKPSPEKAFIRKKIGNTVYRVSVQFSGKSKERLEDKILRLAKQDAANMKIIVGR